jgi:hypothetical protein
VRTRQALLDVVGPLEPSIDFLARDAELAGDAGAGSTASARPRPYFPRFREDFRTLITRSDSAA